MKPFDWLCVNAPGFDRLSEDERTGILYFSLLWSLFEARELDTDATANRIVSLAHTWTDEGLLEPKAFATELAYFIDRYCKAGRFTEHFSGLNLRPNDNPQLVEAVLKGEDTNDTDQIASLFIIIFRLRNNLFHGVKWSYEIRGQLDNFTNANSALMTAMGIKRILSEQ